MIWAAINLLVFAVSFGISWLNGRLGFALWIVVTLSVISGALWVFWIGLQSPDQITATTGVLYIWIALLVSLVWLIGMTAARLSKPFGTEQVA